ncbi:NAD(P)/FAD-dependent oxidoreductase [Sphaerimonospora thailandensis]|uniref:Glycine oxidase ThiO n=1 Tax=Sphaerimonospora thailandensis TaxID=795644 RepID=A0A8J3R8L6_9ACTN|nr:FAD-dependent oxidoreductase [Sphaerimonospora thailandensis]GIH69357.1 glycine oxidase ThiO [Sphaerimonospora thailandensis]
MLETCDVAIIGGGVIGCAIAHRLGSEGRTVLLVEAESRLGQGASNAAMGGILTQTEPSCLGPLTPVIKRSRDLYPDWVAEIAEISGVTVSLLEGGDLQVAVDDAEMDRLKNQVLPRWRESPFPVEQLTGAEARELEPMLSEAVVGGFLLPDELALDPRELMGALCGALDGMAAAIRVRTGVRAEHLAELPGSAEVRLDDGTRVSAGTVIVAAGCLSGGFLPDHHRHLYPIKGEAFDTRPPGGTGYPLRHHIFAEIRDGDFEGYPYLVPRRDGRVAMGVTYEPHVGDVTVTARAREEILRGVGIVMPQAATWPIERSWAGLRPGSTDHIPIIGYTGERVLAATGHSGLGITLAPVTAELVSAVLNGNADDGTRQLLGVCRPDREFVPVMPGETPSPTAP